MPLNNAAADAAANAYCSANGITDNAAKAKWQSLMRQIATMITGNAQVTLGAGTVVTTGSAATQTGPAAPVVMTVT